MNPPKINIDQLRLDAQEFAGQHHQPSEKSFLARWRFMACRVLEDIGLSRREISQVVSDENQTLTESTVGYNLYSRHADDFEVEWIKTLIARHVGPIRKRILKKPELDMKKADKIYDSLSAEERFHIVRKVDLEYHETTQGQIKALQDEVIDLEGTVRALEVMLERALVNRKNK